MSDPRRAPLIGNATARTRPDATAWLRYAVAVGIVALATILTWLLARLMGVEQPRIPFALFFPAVVVATWYGGRGPGLFAILLSALLSALLFLSPGFSLNIGLEGFLQVCVFLLVALLMSYLMERSTNSEASAQRSEGSLSTTLRSIGDAVIATDTRGRITFMNGVAQSLTGWTEHEARGRELPEVFRIVNEETREAVENPVEKVLREGNVVGLANHTLLLAKDSTAEWPIDDSGAPIRDAAGNIIGVVLVFHDITERKLAEEALRESEERLRTIAETASDAIITIDEHSQIVFVNTATAKIFGHTSQEMIGHSLTMLMPDYLRRAHEFALGRYVETGHKHISWELVELPGLHKAGHEILLEVSFAEFMIGGVRHFTGVARDISERKQAEEARARLAAIVESSDDAIIGKTLDGIITSWNKGAERIYGYAAEEIVGQPISTIIPPELHDQLTEILSHLKAGKRVENLETLRIRKDGTRINAAVTISPTWNQAGTIIGASTIARDTTEQKRAEEMIRASEERYRYLAESMPQIVWTARPDGYLDYYNSRWFEYTGMTMEQTQGWGWQPVLHPDDLERCLKAWAKSVMTGERYEIEYRFKRASDDAYRWHLARAEPMRDAAGQIVKWFGTATDIHDHRQAAESLRFMAEASELLTSSLNYEATLERLARLCVAALADYCLIDVVEDDGEIRRVATAHRDPAQEELVRALKQCPPDMNRAEGVSKVIRTGRPEIVAQLSDEKLQEITCDHEHTELLRRLGLKSYMTLPLRTRERIVGALTFAVTEDARSYTPANLSFAQELARRAALAIDNARLYSRAQEANKAKDEFLATLSHELRTPLTPIIGWLQMIRDGRISEADTRHGLTIIEKNSQALTRLINDLLDMSSILSGKMRIERAPVEVGAALHEAVETIRPQADSRGIPLEVAECIGDAHATVSGDRTRLVQVFWNLLNNSVKFSDAGQRITVGCETRDGVVRVIITDEGRGMEPEFLPHAFERFRQADSTTTRVYGGLGIGLALVKSFVEAHGGTTTVESEGTGRGSRFTVTLPRLDAPVSARVETLAEEVEQRAAEGVCRVLVVEDARDTLDMLQVVFETRGYHVTACSTAEEALRVAQTAVFDIIVSDIGLPQIDGYELIRRLRAIPQLHNVPAVALTGYAAPRDAESVLAAGFDVHVPKPVDPATLASEIEQLLQRRARHEDPQV